MAAWFAIASSSFCVPDGAVSSCVRMDIRVSRTNKDQEAQATHQCGFSRADFDEQDGFRQSLPQAPSIDHKSLLRRGFVDDNEF